MELTRLKEDYLLDVHDLPFEIVVSFFSFLDARNLGTMCLVSHYVKQTAEHDSLWFQLCKSRWDRKQRKSVDMFISQRGDMKKSWKKIYMEAEIDAKRVKLTIDDLCDYSWVLKYKGGPGSLYSMYNQIIPVANPVFHRNHIIHMHERDMRYRFTPSGGIQIEQFPPFCVSRVDSTWGFVLENDSVSFQSIDKHKPHISEEPPVQIQIHKTTERMQQQQQQQQQQQRHYQQQLQLLEQHIEEYEMACSEEELESDLDSEGSFTDMSDDTDESFD